MIITLKIILVKTHLIVSSPIKTIFNGKKTYLPQCKYRTFKI